MLNNYTKQLIDDDCNTILSLVPAMQKNSVAAVVFTPFLSLFCEEALNFCTKYSISVPISSNNSFSVSDIRLKVKLFENTYSKARKMVTNCDYLQDCIFKRKLLFKFMQNWNIHYNLSIIVDGDKNIINNSQYAYYVMQDNKLLKRKIDDVNIATNTGTIKYEHNPPEVRAYGYYCGEIIGSIARVFDDGVLYVKRIESENPQVD